MFHDNESEHSAGHQGCQDPQNDAHHIVVAHPHHRAHIVDLPIDRDLESRTGQVQADTCSHKSKVKQEM